MARLSCVLCLALFAGAAATEANPIGKVIELIEGMKKEMMSEGGKEASAYNEFACFCKSTTDQKSTSVKKGEQKINLLSSDIADKTAGKEDANTQVAERKQEDQDLNTELDETTARCTKQKAEYQAEEADLSNAIQGLKDAIKAMRDSKPSSFIAIKETLGKTFAMAEAMSMLKAPKHKAVAAFIQSSSTVDPSDPEYGFHSDDIIQVCDDLLVDYKAAKKDLDDEWSKTDKGCKATKASLKGKITACNDAMKVQEKRSVRLAKEIAQHREDLVISEGMMKDDEQYLKDLTARCEDRANDYDQRSAMRADELAALDGALKVLKGTVAGATKVNVRAALVQEAAKPSMKVSATAAVLKAVSFLQEASVSVENNALRGTLSQEGKKNKALELLMTEGKRMQSLTLTALAERAAGNPFEKIKGLIQKLIERLLTESANEATKKGFCDTELAKSRKDRDFRFTEAKDLSADLASLEAKRDELTAEIADLTKDIKEESDALKTTTDERDTEKSNNMDTLKTAKEGLDGVNEALLILKSFYKQAAKAASFVQASPVDEDTSGPGFSGNYKGSQSASKAVFALLETIASDFDRTIRTTEESEHNAHREYVAFSQASQSSIAGKTTKKELDEEDLKTTQTSLKTKSDDLQTAMDLLDAALKELEELKPTCIDTGMSYAERVKKREEEIEALGKALTILSP